MSGGFSYTSPISYSKRRHQTTNEMGRTHSEVLGRRRMTPCVPEQVVQSMNPRMKSSLHEPVYHDCRGRRGILVTSNGRHARVGPHDRPAPLKGETRVETKHCSAPDCNALYVPKALHQMYCSVRCQLMTRGTSSVTDPEWQRGTAG